MSRSCPPAVPRVLTKALLDRLLRHPPERRVSLTDSVCRGLEARLGRRGITWCFRYRPPGGEPIRVELGSYPDVSLAVARERAEDERRRRSGVLLPVGEAPTLAAVVEAWAASLRTRRSEVYATEAARLLRREIPPELAGMQAHRLTRGHVRRMVRRIAERGSGTTANRVQACLSSAISWAMEQDDLLLGRLDAHPLLRMPREVQERPATRTLSWSEIRRVWRAAVDIGTPATLAHVVALATMQRRAAVLGGRWCEVDADTGWWDIPGSRMKGWQTAEAHGLRVLPEIVELMRQAGGDDHVFPSEAGEGHLLRVDHATRRISRRSGVRGWSLHDLRRTAASRALELGADELAVQRTLGHRRRGALAHYIHVVRQPAVEEVLSRWQRALLSAVDPGAS